MSKNEALDLLNQKYDHGYQRFYTEAGKFFVSNFQLAKKIGHARSFGMDLADSGMTISDMKLWNDCNINLVLYVQKGGTLPSEEFIFDYGQKIKNYCNNPGIELVDDASHVEAYQRKACFVFSPKEVDPEKRLVVIFDQDHNLVGPRQLGEKQYDIFKEHNMVGGKKFLEQSFTPLTDEMKASPATGAPISIRDSQPAKVQQFPPFEPFEIQKSPTTLGDLDQN